MKNIFIDTNIFLNFYHYSNEDIEHLQALVDLINGTEEIMLFYSEQTINEFNRNRENKIQDAIKQFDKETLNIKLPLLIQEYDEIDVLRESQKEFNNNKKEILKKLIEDVQNKNLSADKIIFQLLIPCDTLEDEIIKRANNRMKIGNPPGKNNSIGDAIHWEFLLNNVPDNENLFFISGDNDFSSPLDKNILSDYLNLEWISRKKSKIYYYKSLNSFFKDHYPSLLLIDSLKTDKLIEDLSKSGTFNQTRVLIRKLKNQSELTLDQAQRLLDISTRNNQIFEASKYTPNEVGYEILKLLRPYGDKYSELDKKMFHQFYPELTSIVEKEKETNELRFSNNEYD